MKAKLSSAWWSGAPSLGLMVAILSGCQCGPAPGSLDRPDAGSDGAAGAHQDSGTEDSGVDGGNGDAGPIDGGLPDAGEDATFPVSQRHDWQQVNDVAINARGDYVVAWHDESSDPPDTDLSAVRVRAFRADGQPRCEEFVVNLTTEGRQQLGAVDLWPDSSFVVAFETMSFVGAPRGPAFRRFDPHCQPLGEEVVAFTLGSSVDVAVLQDGTFVVVAQVEEGTTPAGVAGSCVYAQRFARDGARLGAPARLSSTQEIPRDQLPRVAASTDGTYTVAWAQMSPAPGSLGGSTARRMSPDGTPLSTPISLGVGVYADRIVHLPSGDFAVLGASLESLGGQMHQRAPLRLFAPDGTPRGSAFLPVTTDGAGVEQIGAGLAAVGCCRLLVSWTRVEPGAAEGPDARARVFGSDGRPVATAPFGSDEFSLVPRDNLRPSHFPEYPVSAANACGQAVFSWIERWESPTDAGVSIGDGDIWGRRLRLMLPAGEATCPE